MNKYILDHIYSEILLISHYEFGEEIFDKG